MTLAIKPMAPAAPAGIFTDPRVLVASDASRRTIRVSLIDILNMTFGPSAKINPIQAAIASALYGAAVKAAIKAGLTIVADNTPEQIAILRRSNFKPDQGATMTIMVGLPGSGKSTKTRLMVAEDSSMRTIRVNRDDIRKMVFGSIRLTQPALEEPRITVIQEAVAVMALKLGLCVIIDDTNIHPMARKNWEKMAKQNAVPFTMIPVLTDVEECIARDAKRFEELGECLVGREVIERMAETFLRTLG